MHVELSKIQTYVINKQQDDARRRHITERLSRYGFVDFEFVRGQELCDSAIGCAISHIKIFHSQPAAPFLLLEDDIEFTDAFTTELTVPADTDCVYLGRSRFGVVPNSPRSYKYGLFDGYVISDYDHDYYRVYNMLGGHCILFLTQRYVDEIYKRLLDYFFDKDFALYADVAYANTQIHFNVLTPKVLFTYQKKDLGGEELPTKFELKVNYSKGNLALTHDTDSGAYPFRLSTEKEEPGLVTVDLVGGLGNTMFTVATAYAYAKSNGSDLVVRYKDYAEGHCSEISPYYPKGSENCIAMFEATKKYGLY